MTRLVHSISEQWGGFEVVLDVLRGNEPIHPVVTRILENSDLPEDRLVDWTPPEQKKVKTEKQSQIFWRVSLFFVDPIHCIEEGDMVHEWEVEMKHPLDLATPDEDRGEAVIFLYVPPESEYEGIGREEKKKMRFAASYGLT